MARRITTLTYRAGSALARALPEPVALATTRMLAVGAVEALWERRLVVERNLRRVHGPELSGLKLRRAVQQTFASYARYWTESFRLPGMSADELDGRFASEGVEHIVAARQAGHGAILALPHLGGWEWAAFWLWKVRGIPLTAVVEPLEPPELFEWFADFRRSLGMEIIALGPSAGTQVMAALRANRVVCLLSDRDIGGSGVEVELLGERTTLPGGPATLALRTGAPVLPTAVYFEGSGHLARVGAPLPAERHGRLRDDVTRVTADLAGVLGDLIRVAPEQWHLLQPNWPSDHVALAEARARRRSGLGRFRPGQ